VEYTLIRSKRRTVAIHIIDGGVEVRAPLRMSRRDIDRFVISKEKWISDKLAKSKEQAKRREAFALDYGDAVLYRGKPCPIIAREGRRPGFDGTAFYMPPGLTPEEIMGACMKVYRVLAKDYFAARAFELAARMGVRPAAVRISGAKTRWGSCSVKKNINFSWRLIMADDEVIDYVIVHELAHLKEMNHSAGFWAVVEGVMPDYRKRKAGLREVQRRLAVEDWRNADASAKKRFQT